MQGQELKALRERILMPRESLAALLGVSPGQVRSWERLGKTGINTTVLQGSVLEALVYAEHCIDPKDTMKFGRAVDTWRLSQGVGFAVYCLLRLQYAEGTCEAVRD